MLICLQECWVGNNSDKSVFEISNYNMIFKGKTASAKGGLVTYIHKTLEFEERDIGNDRSMWEGQFLKVSNSRKKNVRILNLYRPPRESSNFINAFIDDFRSCLDNYVVEIRTS